VIQLPSGVEAPRLVYLVSERPLVVSENPRTCDEESVRLAGELLQERWFREAAGERYYGAIARLVEGCTSAGRDGGRELTVVRA
jgi:hypothetical protein